MAPAPIEFGPLPKEQRKASRPRHLLALSGGGFRGIFTAKILEHLEKASGAPLASRFDLMAGTSVGGILAIGLAAGLQATDLVETMREHGPGIFSRRHTSLGGVFASRYRSDALRSAIVAILGKSIARQPFAELPAPLLVVAVDERTSAPRIFRSDRASDGKGDRLTVIDVALATSAAPTFFPPHQVGDQMFVDGGIIANAPDLTLIAEAMRLYGAELSDIHLCAVGTAGSTRVGTVDGEPGKIAWTMRHELVELIMDAQVALTAAQVEQLRPASTLRIDERPSRRIALDDTAPGTRNELLALAERAVAAAQSSHLAAWRRVASHSATWCATT